MAVQNKLIRALRRAPTAPLVFDHPGGEYENTLYKSGVYDYRGFGFACQGPGTSLASRSIYVTGLRIETEADITYLRQYLFKLDWIESEVIEGETITVQEFRETTDAGWPVEITSEVWESPYLISRGTANLGCAYSAAGYVACWTNEKPYLGDVISWYRLQNRASKGDGATACGDESGNGYHGTFRAEDYPKWVTDDDLACLQFVGDASLDGNNTTIGWVDTTPAGWYSAANDVSNFTTVPASTFEAWFKTNTDYTTRNENGQIFMFSNSSNAVPSIRVGMDIANNGITFSWTDDAWDGVPSTEDKDHHIYLTYAPEGATGLADGEWHHVMAVRHSASSFKLYVDGVLRATSTHTVGTTTLNYSCFGAHVVGGLGYREYVGLLDEVKVSKVARSATYAAKRYADGRKYRIDKNICVVKLSDLSKTYIEVDAYPESTNVGAYNNLYMDAAGNIYAGFIKYAKGVGDTWTTGWDVRSTLYLPSIDPQPDPLDGMSEIHAWRTVKTTRDVIVVGKNGSSTKGPLIMHLNGDTGASEWEWGWDTANASNYDAYITTLATDAASDPWELRYVAVDTTGDVYTASRNVLYRFSAGGESPRWVRRLPIGGRCVGIELSEGSEKCVQCLIRIVADGVYSYYVQLYNTVTGQPMGIWYERQTPILSTTSVPIADYGELFCDTYGFVARLIEPGA